MFNLVLLHVYYCLLFSFECCGGMFVWWFMPQLLSTCYFLLNVVHIAILARAPRVPLLHLLFSFECCYFIVYLPDPVYEFYTCYFLLNVVWKWEGEEGR